jgi:general secretion pathway protein K
MEVQHDSSTSLAAAIADRDTLRAEYHARSGINLARLLIGTEPTVRQAITPIMGMLGMKPPQIPVWAFADQVLGPFNDSGGAESFQALSGVDASTGTNLGLGADGHFTIAIVDEDSKINVNTAAKGDVISQMRITAQIMGLLAPIQYNPLFENPDPDEQYSDRATICGALIDWADSDENLQPCDLTTEGPVAAGSEDNYYQTIGLPYFRKNAAFDSLDELRLVRGIGDDFWATFVEPEPDKPDKRVVTVWGQGKVNVNTANAMTLLAVVCAGAPDAELCLDPVQMESFIMGVTLARSFTMGAPLFGSATDFINMMKGTGLVGPVMQALGVQPVTFKSDMKDLISTQSKMFSIYADGVVPGPQHETHVRLHAVVDFRQASELGSSSALDALQSLAAGLDGTSKSGVSNPTPSGSGTVGMTEMTPEQMAAALASNPLGQVVYWRME